MARKGEFKLTEDETRALCLDYVLFDNSYKELKRNYGISQEIVRRYLSKGVKLGFITEEQRKQRKKNIPRPTKLSEDETRAVCLDYVYFADSQREITKNYAISSSVVYDYLDKGIKLGFITEEQRKNASYKRKKNEIGKFNRSTNYKLTEDETRAVCLDYVLFDDSYKELKENYGSSSVSNYLKNGVKLGFITEEQRKNASHRRQSNNGKDLKLHKKGIFGRTKKQKQADHRMGSKPKKRGTIEFSYEARVRMAQSHANSERCHLWELDGNRFGSQSEAAAGSILKKYIPGYKIIRGKTFQVNGDTPCIFDFNLEKIILEWHPINIKFESEERDYKAFRELRFDRSISLKQRREFESDFRNDLAFSYWFYRQLNSDNSKIYKGKEVELAQTVKELYQILGRNGATLPDFDSFSQEFKHFCGKAKKIKPKPEK